MSLKKFSWAHGNCTALALYFIRLYQAAIQTKNRGFMPTMWYLLSLKSIIELTILLKCFIFDNEILNYPYFMKTSWGFRRVHLLKQTLEFSGCVIQHEFIFLFFLLFLENLYQQNGDIINSITSDLIIDLKKRMLKSYKIIHWYPTFSDLIVCKSHLF